MIGKTISHYKILEKLGGGGMGVVYKAQDTKLDRTVALKFLPPHLHLDEEAEKRFISEAKASSSFDHPNICTIHDINKTEDDQFYIVMGYYTGETLKKKVGAGPMQIDNAINYAAQIAAGLVRAHEAGIVHRDIKPANIMITDRNEVKILDFGLAKTSGEPSITKLGSTVGTVSYMSPEQTKGEEVDHRSDIWSLGVVLYQMLSGSLPFQGEYDQAIIYSILNDEPKPIKDLRSDVPKELVDIVLKAMAKNPDVRYQSVDELQNEMNNFMESQRNSGKTTRELESSERHRKLSAIMFTDMVGYSALTQKNESLAIELLEEHRWLLRPLFSKHGGKEIEAIGDAFFVEFNSALEAVSCAIEIQKNLHERNSKIDPEKQIKIRIGLHIGDVIHIGKHVHGDGVNIAARLEPLSAPGGICLSEDVARQIKNKIDLPVKNLGPQKLKNIQSTIDVYCIQFPWESKKILKSKFSPAKFFLQRNVVSFILILFAVITVLFIWNKFQSPSINKSNNRIAVLPLVNISQNSEDDYFTDGMTEELISQLAKISGLNVIARTSVMKYKNTQMNIKEIGRELDVGTILEGSVRKASDKARITIQLIDVETQEHLWSDEYDREMKDIFDLQSDIALRIANELKVQLLSTEKQQIKKRNTENAEAYRSYLLGKYQLNNRTPESLKNALKYFKTAISLDPNYAIAYVGLTDCYTLISGAAIGYIPREEAIEKANDAIKRAVDLDPTSAEAYNSLAYLKFRLEWDWEEAENYFKKAIELKPGYSSAYERYALYLALLGRNEESIQLMNRAYELDPLSPSVSTGVGRMYHFAKQFDKAIEQFEETLKMNPDYVETVFALGMSNSVVGNYDQSIQQLKKAVELSNGRLIILTFLARTYAAAGMIEEAEKIRDKFISLQSEKKVSPFHFAIIDAALGNKDAAIDSLYRAYDEHFGILVYLKASPLFEKLFDQPRFYELKRKIGLEK